MVLIFPSANIALKMLLNPNVNSKKDLVSLLESVEKGLEARKVTDELENSGRSENDSWIKLLV